MENNISINLRISKDLHAMIIKAAEKEERSITSLLRVLIRQALTDKSKCKTCS